MPITEADVAALVHELDRERQAWIEGCFDPAGTAGMVQAPDMTIFGPFGGDAAWAGPELAARQIRAAAQFHGGSGACEVVKAVVEGDVAVLVLIERNTVTCDGDPEPRPWVLRTTQVFRHEGGRWLRLHRHADPLTTFHALDPRSDSWRLHPRGEPMIPLPAWMRRALLATAVMNLLAGPACLPAAAPLRALAGLPEGHALYTVTVGLFIVTFGFGYLAAGLTGRADRLFMAVAAGGKLGFFGLMTVFWALGEVPVRAVALASADLVFGALFVAWLLGIGVEMAARPAVQPAR